MFWFKVADLTGKTGNGFLFDTFAAFNIQARLSISGASGGLSTKGTLHLTWRTPTALAQFDTTTAWDDGNWHRCLVVRRSSGNFIEMYIDGVSQGSDAVNNPTTDATAATAQMWGNNGSVTTQSFGGSLARCAFVAGTVLTAGQADTFLYAGDMPTGVLLSQWLEMKGASPEVDRSGNGLNGTIAGTTFQDASPPYSGRAINIPLRLPHPLVGPMVVRVAWAIQTPLTWTNLAPITDTNFILPTYPSAVLRMVGPMITRRQLVRFYPQSGADDFAIALTGASTTGSVGTTTPSITVALTGASATASTGTLAPTNSPTLSGNAGTSANGSVALTITVALVDNAASSATGTIAPTNTLAISGNADTSSVGTLAPDRSVSISGNSVTGSNGTVDFTKSGSLTLSGNSASGSAGTCTPSISVSLASNNSTSSVGSLDFTKSGSLALTGNGSVSSQGSLTPSASVALAGNEAIASVGSITPSLTVSLTGNPGTSDAGVVIVSNGAMLVGNESVSQVGNLGILSTKGLSNVSASSAVGTINPSVAIALTGHSATSQAGSISPPAPSSASLTGNAATGSAGSVSIGITIALSGNQASGSIGLVTSRSQVLLIGTTAIGSAGNVYYIVPTETIIVPSANRDIVVSAEDRNTKAVMNTGASVVTEARTAMVPAEDRNA